MVLEKTLESPLDCKEIQPVHFEGGHHHLHYLHHSLALSQITGREHSPLDCKEISPGCSLEGLMLKLKFEYFGHLMRRVDSLEKTLMLGKVEGRMRRG